MQAFSAKTSSNTIKLNSRVFVDELLTDYIGLDGVEANTIRRLIDKRNKNGTGGFGRELTQP